MSQDNTATPTGPRDGAPAGRSRHIAPLVWIVLAILAAWLVIALVQRGGSDRSPHGNATPREAEGASYMPASPAHDGAPATPAAQVNGPQQPPGDNPR